MEVRAIDRANRPKGLFQRFITNIITILHCYALILDPADVAAQLVLSIGILDQLSLHRESPHLFEGVPLQLHLIQDLRAHLDHFVRVQLKLYFSFKNSQQVAWSCDLDLDYILTWSDKQRILDARMKWNTYRIRVMELYANIRLCAKYEGFINATQWFE